MLLAGQSVQVPVEDQHHRTAPSLGEAPPGAAGHRQVELGRGGTDLGGLLAHASLCSVPRMKPASSPVAVVPKASRAWAGPSGPNVADAVAHRTPSPSVKSAVHLSPLPSSRTTPDRKRVGEGKGVHVRVASG